MIHSRFGRDPQRICRLSIDPLGHEVWRAVQASSSSTGLVLTTRSGGTSHSSARSQPYGCQSSWPGACASVSTENRQPVSTASRSSRRGGSSRSGRELISTATPNCAARLEHQLGVELRLAAGAPATGDQPAGAVAEDVGVRVGHRRYHPAGHRLAVHLQLGVHRGHDDVEAGRAARRTGPATPSSRMSTSMPVEQPERCQLAR